MDVDEFRSVYRLISLLNCPLLVLRQLLMGLSHCLHALFDMTQTSGLGVERTDTSNLVELQISKHYT